MLNAPNNQYVPFIPVQQQQMQQPLQQAAPAPTGQGQQPAPNGGIYSYPAASAFVPPSTDFNGVKLIINNPQGYAGNAAAPNTAATVPAAPWFPQQPLPQQPEQIPAAQPAQTPEPAVKTEPVTNKPEIEEPTQEVPGMKVQSFTAGLNSDDINTQAKAMQDICDAAKSADDKVVAALQCNEIYDALLNIVNKDTSNLQGPTDEMIAKRNELLAQAKSPEEHDAILAQTASEKETMVLHQREALCTIAILQNAIISLGEKSGKEVQIQTIPAIDTMVETVKSNPEPILRATAIQSLSHIARPSFKPELSEIFSIATTDANPDVQQIASKANQELEELQ